MTIETNDTARQRSPVKVITHQGLEVHVDRPQGSVREGTGPDGKPYMVQEKYDYGFFPGTRGDDADSVDAYVSHENPLCPSAFVVRQVHPKNGAHDECKVMLGFASLDEAKAGYLAHVHPSMFGRIGQMPMEAIKGQLGAHLARERTAETFVPHTDEDMAEHAAMKAAGEALKSPSDAYTIPWQAKTNFPASGDDKAVAFRNSTAPKLDTSAVEAAMACWPGLWDTIEEGGGHTAMLCRISRTGGLARTHGEIAALKIRESIAELRNAELTGPTALRLTSWLLVHKDGFEAQKAAVEAMAAEVKSGPSSYPAPEKAPPSSSYIAPPGPPANEKPEPVQMSTERSEDLSDPGPLSQRSPTTLSTSPGSAMPNAHHRIERLIGLAASLTLFAPQHASTLQAAERDALLGWIRDAAPTGGDASVPGGAGSGAPTVSRSAGAEAAPAVPHALSDGELRNTKRSLDVTVDKVTTRALSDGEKAAWEIAKLAGLVAGAAPTEQKVYWFTASTEAVDSYYEIVRQEWDFSRFEKNPVILFSHKSREFPIGRADEWKIESGALRIGVVFSNVNPTALLARAMLEEKTLRAGSVGFMPGDVTYETINGVKRVVLRNNLLHEFSLCAIPANPEALVDEKSLDALEQRMTRAFENVVTRMPLSGASEPPTNTSAPVSAHKGAAPTNPSIPGVRSMFKLSLDPVAALKAATDGHVTIKCAKCAEDHEIDLAAIKGHIDSDRAKLASDLKASGEALAAKAVELAGEKKRADDALTALARKKLEPITGAEHYQLTPAQSDSLSRLAISSPAEFEVQLAASQERFEKGKKQADELAKLTGATPATRATDPTPPSTAANLGEQPNAKNAPAAPAPEAAAQPAAKAQTADELLSSITQAALGK